MDYQTQIDNLIELAIVQRDSQRPCNHHQHAVVKRDRQRFRFVQRLALLKRG